MRHVDFYVDSEGVLHIRQLDGAMRSRKNGRILFDDKSSFITTIDTAEVGLTGVDLSALLNKFVFGYKGSPLSHLHVRTEGVHIVQTGRMHKSSSPGYERTLVDGGLEVWMRDVGKLDAARTRKLLARQSTPAHRP
jgi:hypothetical protein